MKKAVGLDLGGTFIKIGVVTDTGKILKKGHHPSRADEGNRDIVLDQMAMSISRILEGFKHEEIAGIGIGTPGLIDRRGNVFEAPNIPGWDNLPLKTIFEEKFGMPVVVENDVNSIAWGEYLFGAGKGSRTMICITLGTGLGGGIVLDGHLLRGGEYSAVEIGHIPVAYRGPRCLCGNTGCIEALVSRDAIIRRAADALQQGRPTIIADICGGDRSKITPRMISEAFQAGDPLAREIWVEVGTALGALFSGMINLLNPDRIVIGGGIAQAGDILFDTIRTVIAERAMKKLSKDVSVVPAGLGNDAGIVSDAALIFQP